MSKENQPATEAVAESTVQTVEIFTQEQLLILPEDTRKSIVSLTETLPAKQLLVLNPLVSKLIQIKAHETIKYDKDNPETVESYKVAKKEIAAFIKAAGDTKTAIKKPLDAIGKEVLAIEKGVVSIANAISGVLGTEFKEFEDAETKRKDEATAKKNKKATDQINALAEQNKEANNQVTKTNFLNKVKHNELESWELKVTEAVENYQQEALLGLKNDLAILNHTDLDTEAAELITKEILIQDEYNVAISIYQTKLTGLQKRIDDKIELLSTRKQAEQTATASAASMEAVKTFAGYGIGGMQAAPVKEEIQPEPEAITQNDSENAMAEQFINLFFTEDLNADGSPNTKAQLQDLANKLEVMKVGYTKIFDKAKPYVTTQEEADNLKKLSGVCVLFGRVIEYINQ